MVDKIASFFLFIFFITEMKIFSQNTNNISFGMTLQNKKIVRYLLKSPANEFKKRAEIIKSVNINDSDKNILKIFKKMMVSNTTTPLEMNAVLDKLGELKKYPKKINTYFENILKNWGSQFKSIRQKSAAILDKLNISHPEIGELSRSAMGKNKIQVLKNIKTATKHILKTAKQNVCPDKKDLITLHKIFTKSIVLEAESKKISPKFYGGIISGSSLDKTGLTPLKANTEQELDKFFAKLNRDYNKVDIFTLSAKAYKKMLSILPFYDANGRTSRAFVDSLLLSKGQLMTSHPSNYAEVRSMPTEDLAKLIKNHCKKV